jgi:hypothetical protein
MKIKSYMKLYNSHMKEEISYMKPFHLYVNFGNFICEFSYMKIKSYISHIMKLYISHMTIKVISYT